jgi:hypothetical protein
MQLQTTPYAFAHTYQHEPFITIDGKIAQQFAAPQTIAKSTYWWDRRGDDGLYCATVSSDQEVDRSKLHKILRGTAAADPAGICFAKTFPMGQEPGRLSPFILQDDVEEGRIKAIVYDSSLDLETMMDFSHPLDPETSVKMSLQEVHKQLFEQFGPSLPVIRADIGKAKPRKWYSRVQ